MTDFEYAELAGKYEAMADYMATLLIRGGLDEHSKKYAEYVKQEIAENGLYSKYVFTARQHGDVQILESKDNGGV